MDNLSWKPIIFQMEPHGFQHQVEVIKRGNGKCHLLSLAFSQGYDCFTFHIISLGGFWSSNLYRKSFQWGHTIENPFNEEILPNHQCDFLEREISRVFFPVTFDEVSITWNALRRGVKLSLLGGCVLVILRVCDKYGHMGYEWIWCGV